MNTNFPDLLINGLLICLYSQLILLGIFNILHRTSRNVVLGGICCLLSLSFIYTLYWPSLNTNLTFNLLIGGYKHMFLPALIYLYLVLLLRKENRQSTILVNLLLPISVHVLYLSIKFGFKDFYDTNINSLVAIINSFIFFSYCFYFLKGRPLLEKLEPLLLTKIHKRYKVFFYVMTLYGIVLVAEALLPFLMGSANYQRTFSFLSNDFYITLAVLINLGVLLFSIIESPKLKSLLVGNKIYTGFDSISNEEAIQKFISDYFDKRKIFTSADFDIRECLKDSGIGEKDFKLFLKKIHNMTIIEFINTRRVNEFKSIVSLDENLKYSLMGIANKVGFNSKATFYRNFRAVEGITPKQYWEKIKNSEIPPLIED